MKFKKIVILLILITAILFSLTAVSAGWFDFLYGDTSNPIDDAIVLPNNTTEITAEKEGYRTVRITSDTQTRYSGASYYHGDDHSSVTYTSKGDVDMLNFQISADFDVREIDDETTRNYLINLVKSYKEFDSKDADSIPAFFTNPNSTNGGMYLKFYDKNNNTVLTQNIVFQPSDDSNEDYIHAYPKLEYDEHTDSYLGDRKVVKYNSFLYINADSKEGMLDNITKADRCELHILLTNGSNTDICIPIETFEKTL